MTGLVAGFASGGVALSVLHTTSDTLYSQSDKVIRDGYEVVLVASSIEEFYEPDSGVTFYYAVAEVSIKNTSSDVLAFIPVYQTQVRTLDGVERFDMSPLPSLESPINAGDILPGETVTGQLSYLVSGPNKELLLLFEPGWNNTGPVQIKI